MPTKVKIALSVPSSTKLSRYFSLQLKQGLHSEPSEYHQPPKVLVVSDIAGDFLAFRRLLRKFHVIDNHYKWTFEDGHLVILGNCFDKEEQLTECLWLIYSLEEKSQKEGGYVHFVLGNHEILNMNGGWRYVHPKYAERREGSAYSPTALYDASGELGRWIRTKNIIEKIGDILFVHAGISPEMNMIALSLSQINNLARPYYADTQQIFTDPLLYTIFNSKQSPFLYGGYYQGIATEEQIDETFRKFNITTIVTGHIPMDHVSSFFNRKVINVDTDHMGGTSEALLILGHHFYRVDGNGTKERLK